MEGRTTEQDYFEFEMLLGEIPNATSEMGLYGGLNISDSQFDRNPEGNRSIDAIHCYKSPRNNAEQAGAYFPDCKSSASAFREFMVMDNNTTKANAAALVTCGLPSPNQGFLMDGYDQCHSIRPLYECDSAGIHIAGSHASFDGGTGMPILPSSTSDRGSFSNLKFQECDPFTTRNGADIFSGEIAVQDGGKLLIPNAHEIRSSNVESFPSDYLDKLRIDPVCLQTVPAAYPEMDAFHLFPRITLPGVDLTASTLLHRYYFHKEYSAYKPPHHFDHTNMTWMNSGTEACYGIYQQLYYQQQLQNQGPQFPQIGCDVNSSVIPFHFKEFNGNLHQNSTSVKVVHNQLNFPRSSVCPCLCCPRAFGGQGEGCRFCNSQKLRSASGLTCSVTGFRKDEGLNINEKGFFPEFFLTRSRGANSLKTLRSNPMTLNHLASTANNHDKPISNSPVRHLHVLRNGCFPHDGQNCSIPPTYTSVDEVVGTIYYMAKDQDGCRFLQRKFVEGTHEDVERIFVEVICCIVELMTDQFGNYLVQKLLEVCTEDQRLQIVHAITRNEGELFRVSCDMHGTRAVQKVIETTQTIEQISLVVSSIKPHIVDLIKHVNGNHVAQRCLQHIPDEFSEFLYEAASAHCVELATNRQGCCVMQKCLHHSNDCRKRKLISVIASNAFVLSQDQYGNYVVQFALDQNVPSAIAILLDKLEGNYGYLSMQKYSSNVVEKCLKLAGEDKRANIIQELMNSSLILQILLDPFGNYVIQSALNESKGSLRSSLIEAIRPHVPLLRNSLYGKRILPRIFRKK